MLLTLAGIGIMSMVVGFLFFTGAASSVNIDSDPLTWNRLFFGFNFRILTAFGFFLLLIGLFPVLAVLDASAKRGVKKLYVHLVLLVGFGLITLIYSMLSYPELGDQGYLKPLDSYQTWFDYFIVAALLIIIGLSPLLFSVQNRERLWNFKLLFGLFIVVGLLLQIISMVISFGIFDLTEMGLPEIGWDYFFLFGIIILFLGLVPLLLTASTRFRNVLHRLRIFWILGALIGIGILLGSYLVFTNPELIDLDIDWVIYFVYGTLLTILTVLLLVSSKQLHKTIYKLRYIWLLSLFLGIILVVISTILVLPTSPDIEAAIGTLLGNDFLGATWDIFYMYGIIITIVSLIIICSILYFETEEFIGLEGLIESVERLPDIEASSSEMIAYLEILSKSHENMVNQFKEAVRADKFRPRVYEAIVKEYQYRNRNIKSRIERFRKAGAIVSGVEEVETLFDVALGEPSEVVPSAPSPPPPTEVAKPAPPPTPPPTGPPAPSSQVPSPPPSPLSAPPAPGVMPSQPTESPLDLIADARSTSIAELRGEMLKELRRLREIFKEE